MPLKGRNVRKLFDGMQAHPAWEDATQAERHAYTQRFTDHVIHWSLRHEPWTNAEQALAFQGASRRFVRAAGKDKIGRAHLLQEMRMRFGCVETTKLIRKYGTGTLTRILRASTRRSTFRFGLNHMQMVDAVIRIVKRKAAKLHPNTTAAFLDDALHCLYIERAKKENVIRAINEIFKEFNERDSMAILRYMGKGKKLELSEPNRRKLMRLVLKNSNFAGIREALFEAEFKAGIKIRAGGSKVVGEIGYGVGHHEGTIGITLHDREGNKLGWFDVNLRGDEVFIDAVQGEKHMRGKQESFKRANKGYSWNFTIMRELLGLCKKFRINAKIIDPMQQVLLHQSADKTRGRGLIYKLIEEFNFDKTDEKGKYYLFPTISK